MICSFFSGGPGGIYGVEFTSWSSPGKLVWQAMAGTPETSRRRQEPSLSTYSRLEPIPL